MIPHWLPMTYVLWRMDIAFQKMVGGPYLNSTFLVLRTNQSILQHVSIHMHIDTLVASATCSSRVRTTHINTHIDGTAIGSNLRFSILPTSTCRLQVVVSLYIQSMVQAQSRLPRACVFGPTGNLRLPPPQSADFLLVSTHT